jgi:hypothetical protein
MSPKIYNTKDPLNLERLRLAKPINRNGSHFIKTLNIDDPIYFLSPKCFVKQGFVKSGKKIFCDFVFSNEDSDFLAWLEDLEERSRKCIYDNRETWFETPLDEHDIESSMSPPYKSYKSGKYFIVRANVPTALDKINIKIYDETENETDPENIKENTKVLAVLEFQGIRCSVRSFQFEIELKQMLVVEPEKLFEKCIISTGNPIPKSYSNPLPTATPSLSYPTEIVEEESNHIDEPEYLEVKETNSFEQSSPSTQVRPELVRIDEQRPSTTCASQEYFAVQEVEEIVDSIPSSIEEPQTIDEPIVPVELIDPEMPIEILDGDFPLEDIQDLQPDNDPPLKLKSRNDVYYKLYKEMRQRAKEAKREALANYLEAKRIKNTYLLEDLSDSEDDEDDLDNMEV